MIIYYIYFCKYYGKFQVTGKRGNVQVKIQADMNIIVNVQSYKKWIGPIIWGTAFVILLKKKKKKGMTLANFQSDENLQVRKEYLSRILRGKHIVSEVAFSIWWLIPSFPHALSIWRVWRMSFTSSTFTSIFDNIAFVKSNDKRL